jgi:nucleoid-associated protein YgaU
LFLTDIIFGVEQKKNIFSILFKTTKPMSTEQEKEIEDLKRTVRQKRNAAQAGIFVAVVIAILSAGWLFLQSETQMQKSLDAKEVIVSSDSLKQIQAKIQEQELFIQTQTEEITRLRTERESAEMDGTVDEDRSENESNSDSEAMIETGKSVKNASNRVMHVIEKGETLWSIAVKYFDDGHRNSEIAAANGIVNAGHIVAGETLRFDQ